MHAPAHPGLAGGVGGNDSTHVSWYQSGFWEVTVRMKYTFLSRWTVLILTIATFGLAYLGFWLFSQSQPGYGVLSLLVGGLLYALAWLVAFFDSIQERKIGWIIGLLLLLPFGIGPILYSVIGPKNTR